MTQKIVYGNNTEILNNGNNTSFQISITSGDIASLKKELLEAGLPENAANEISNILASDTPGTREEPLGEEAKTWLSKNFSKAVDGTWKIGISTLSGVLTAAAKQYYGL